MNLGIIGTAGRKEDGAKLSLDTYIAMSKAAEKLVADVGADSLVSGGAAYADHIAVRLFLRGRAKNLTLHLPCKWDDKKKTFKDSGEFNYRTNPGGTANYYHRKFSDVCQLDSLLDIAKAIHKGAKVVVTEGFKERNTKVAEEAEVLLAMTFGQGAYIKDGGTADTARKFFESGKVRGYHFDIGALTMHDDIILI